MKLISSLLPKTLIAFLLSGCVIGYAREVHDLCGTWDFSLGGTKERVTVPHTWNAKDAAKGPKSSSNALSVQSTVYRRGKATYTREIPVTIKAGKRYFVRGEGASIVSEVFVNDKSAGKHEGAFGAFCYEVTDLLKPGAKNTLKITVDNTYNDDIVPLSGDFSMFGGLYRPVALIETDALCISPVYFASPGVIIKQEKVSRSSAEITVETMLNGKAGTPADVSISVKDATGKVVKSLKTSTTVPANKEEPVKQKLMIAPVKLWQGRENPYLYTVEVTVTSGDGSSDTVVQPLGLRTAKITADKGFDLNGKMHTLHGVSRHQDLDGKGWALSKEDEENDIKLMVDMGVDGLRTAHYPQSEHIYDLCDKYGIVVWSEVSAIEKVRSRPKFIENMKLQAKEMVLQHGNHPSICMWGIFNEIFHQTNAEDKKVDMVAVLKDMNAYMHTLDKSRPTVAATNQPDNASLNSIPDHLAANLYPGWYGGSPESMGAKIDAYRKKNPKRGFGVSEYGHGADIGTHEYPLKQPSPSSSKHPEEWQAYGHEMNYREIKKRPQLFGTYVWCMFDFASANRKEGARAGINDKGLVTYDRKTCKDAYYFYKANWNTTDPMIYLTSKRYTKRPAGNVEVKAYTTAPNAELYINGKKVGKTEKADDIHVVHWKDVPLKAGTNKVEVRASQGGKKLTDSCVWTCS